MASFEKDLDIVVRALALPRYALLGTSQGAATSIAHAVRRPEHISKMVLHGAYALGRNRRGSLKEYESGQAYLTLMRHGWGDEHSAFLKSYSLLFFPNASVDQIRALAELQRMATSAETAVKIRAACDDLDVVNLLSRVRAPTLVLHSRYDSIVPLEEGRRVAASIPGARFVCLESENRLYRMNRPGVSSWAKSTRFLRGSALMLEWATPAALGLDLHRMRTLKQS